MPSAQNTHKHTACPRVHGTPSAVVTPACKWTKPHAMHGGGAPAQLLFTSLMRAQILNPCVPKCAPPPPDPRARTRVPPSDADSFSIQHKRAVVQLTWAATTHRKLT